MSKSERGHIRKSMPHGLLGAAAFGLALFAGQNSAVAQTYYLDLPSQTPGLIDKDKDDIVKDIREVHREYTAYENCINPRVARWIEEAENVLRALGNRTPNDYWDLRALDEIKSELARLKALPPCRDYVPVFSRTGILLGLYLIKTTGEGNITERFIATDQITNAFNDRKDPLGVGVSLAYKFTPWGNVAVAPFVAFDYLNAAVNHTFPNGSFLGTTANFSGTAGVKVGPQLDMGLWLYGIAGVSVLNETLNVSFIPVSSASTVNVAGATVGVGGAFAPNFLKGLGRQVSLFAEYQHTWWQDASFNAPVASPLFNYTFGRRDDTFRFGFTVALDAPPPQVAPTYPVKAPRLK